MWYAERPLQAGPFFEGVRLLRPSELACYRCTSVVRHSTWYCLSSGQQVINSIMLVLSPQLFYKSLVEDVKSSGLIDLRGMWVPNPPDADSCTPVAV